MQIFVLNLKFRVVAQTETNDKTRQDNFITSLHVTVITDLAPQVAEANRGV